MSWRDTIQKDGGGGSAEPKKKAGGWRDTITVEPVKKSGFESGLRGAVQGGTLGFADEAAGVAEALWNKAKGDPEEFGKLYQRFRDESRAEFDQAKKDNPGSYLAGEVGGGIATAFVPGLNVAKGASLAKTVGQTAALGGLYGVGSSEADNVADIAKDAATGAVLGGGAGALGYGAIKGTTKAIQAIPEGVKQTVSHPVQTLKAFGRGARAGAKEAALESVEIPIIKGLQTTSGAIKGGLKEVADSAAAKGEISGIADEARKIVMQVTNASDDAGNALVSSGEKSRVGAFAKKLMKPFRSGESGSIGDMSDDEAILSAVLSDGDNPVKQWLAQKAAVLNPGQGSADDYLNVLRMPSEARNAARSFDPAKAAKELVPDVDKVEDLFTQARGERYGALQNQAMEVFDKKTVNPVVKEIGFAIEDAGKLDAIPSHIKSTLSDAKKIITIGQGTRRQKLNPGELGSVGKEEVFNRLQKAREIIDGKIDWSDAQKDRLSKDILMGVRDSIDEALKTSPQKVEADKVFSRSKQLEDKFFEVTKFGRGGSREIDAEKIKTLLGDNPTARRYSQTLQEMKDFAADPNLKPEFRQKMSEVIRSIEEKVGVADQQRALSSFRYKQGPSSPAIERLQSAVGKQSLIGDAVNAPAGFLNSGDEFLKAVGQRLGKPFAQLSPRDRVRAVRMWSWIKENPGATPAQTDAAWRKFLGK